MLDRLLVALSFAFVACGEPPPPDTPEAREAVAVCGAEAPAEVLAKRIPDLRFAAALGEAAKHAVSPNMSLATSGYRSRDLGERAAAIRSAAEAVGVKRCRLADELQAAATAEPGPDDLDGVVKVLQALGSVSPEYFAPIVAAGCAELPACARECAPGLAAVGEVEAERRALALAGGCAAFRPQVSGGAAAVEAFARARMSDFITACAPKLAGPAAAEVATLRQRLGL
jgi:hypothetical protein